MSGTNIVVSLPIPKGCSDPVHTFLHETGHTFGLGHTVYNNQVMCTSA